MLYHHKIVKILTQKPCYHFGHPKSEFPQWSVTFPPKDFYWIRWLSGFCTERNTSTCKKRIKSWITSLKTELRQSARISKKYVRLNLSAHGSLTFECLTSECQTFGYLIFRIFDLVEVWPLNVWLLDLWPLDIRPSYITPWIVRLWNVDLRILHLRIFKPLDARLSEVRCSKVCPSKLAKQRSTI